VKFMLALIRLVRRTQAVPGSAGCRVAHASRVLAKPSRFRGLLKIVSARRRNQHARRVRYPEFNPRVSRCNPFNESQTFHIAHAIPRRSDDKCTPTSHNSSWSKFPLITPATFIAMLPTARHNRSSRLMRRRTIKVKGKRSHPPTWSRLLSAPALARPWE
jgi:hypothetical protein